MKNFDVLSKELITKQIEQTVRLTIHEIDCNFDLHFDVKRAVCGDVDFSVTGENDSWFTFSIESIVEITFSDELTVIVVDQNLFRKDV